MPYFTQFQSNDYMLNPAVTGTKGTIEALMNYRMQWVGYDGAPSTSGVSLHSRFYKGKMGAGAYVMQDDIGPERQTNFGASYAYHIRFPDCELSAGAAGLFTKYTLIGSKMLLHNSQDPSIDQTLTNSTYVPDANAGFYLYNDRFHIGFSALHLLKSTAHFYKNDSVKKGIINYATHLYFSLGYNYSHNPDYIFENCAFLNYVQGTNLMLDYTLRIHYKHKILAGFSVRLNDALAIHVGATILDNFEVSYSYDFLINRISNYSSGSHEIVLRYSFKTGHDGKVNGKRTKFAHQKYSDLF